MTFKIQRGTGFRVNLTDLAFIGFLIVLGQGIRSLQIDESLSYLPIYVGYSFFLFCNVFRIGLRLEALWYLPFVAFFIHEIANDRISWWIVLVIFEPLKVVLVAYRIVRGPYAGIFHEQINRWMGRSMGEPQRTLDSLTG